MNYLRLLINHIAEIFILIFLLNISIPAQQDTAAAEEINDTVFVMSKSPLAAVLMSAAVPGLGQIYNQSYWKAPVVWGIGAWLVYNWIDLNDKYKFYRNLYLETGNPVYQQLRPANRDERDLFTIYMVLTYFLNLVDAYVDAHLFDFTVDEDFLIKQPRLSIKFFF
jgi:hypothetical protein